MRIGKDIMFQSICWVLMALVVAIVLAATIAKLTDLYDSIPSQSEQERYLDQCDRTIQEARKQFAKDEAKREEERKWVESRIAILNKERK